MDTQSELHVVLGAGGGVGNAVVRALVAQGKRVRGVTRSGKAEVPASVEMVAGEVAQLDQARAVCRDASVVYFCVNPSYTRWPQDFPPLLEGAIAGATAAQAKLIVADNLYVYAPTTQPMTEDMPWHPRTRKGKVRAAMDERLLAAHRSGQLRVAIGRASDFYGPAALNSTLAGERTFAALFAGKPIQWIGQLDVPHTYSFTDDFGRGLVTLGMHEAALGQAWHIPAAEDLTSQQMFLLLFIEANRHAKITRLAPALLRVIGSVSPIVREVNEMAYEFDKPFLMDGTKFTRAFGGQPTPHSAALRATVAWFQAHRSAKG